MIIHVSIESMGCKPLQASVQIDPMDYRTLAPLPRDHDFPGDIRAFSMASRQRNDREWLVANLAKQLQATILEAIESQDTVNGYKKTELS